MDIKSRLRPFSAQPRPEKGSCSPVFQAFRPTSAFSGLQKANEVKNSEDRPEEEKEEEEKCVHSVGCPRYKITRVPKQSISGNVESNPLHPKPWGARDPSMIPCSCFLSRSNRDELKTGRMSSRKSFSQRGAPSGPSLFDRNAHKEVMSLFDDFCNTVARKRVKLTNDELQALSKHLMTKLGPQVNGKKSQGALKKNKEEEEQKKLAVEKSMVEANKAIREVKQIPDPGLRNVIGKIYQGRVNLITPSGENYSEEVLQATSIPTYLTTLEGIQPVFSPLAGAALPANEIGYQAVIVRNPPKPQSRLSNAPIPFWRQ